MPAPVDQDVIEAFGANGPHERSANAFAIGPRMGVRMISVPSPLNTSSKLTVYLESRSLIRNRKESPA